MNKIVIRNPFPILFALIVTAILLILVIPGRAQSTSKFNDGYLVVFKNTTPAGSSFTLTNSTTVNGNASVTVSSTASVTVGMSVAGSNIPTNTAVLSITDGTHFVMSNTASGSSSTVTLTLNGILVSAASAIVLEEYAPTGSQSSPNFSVALPTTGSNRVIASGTAGAAGEISLSENGRYIIVPGYDFPLGTNNSSFTTNGAMRTVNGTGTVGAGIAAGGSTTWLSGSNNVRGGTSDDGTNFWITGNGLGIQYSNNGSTVTTVSGTSTNNRASYIYNGQLYLTSGAGSQGIYSVGTGKPTNTGNTATRLFTPANTDVYGFSISPDSKTIYYVGATTGGGTAGIYRSTYNGSVWTTGTQIAAISGYTGIAVNWTGYTFQTSTANGAVIYVSGLSGTTSTILTANDNGTSTATTTALRTLSSDPKNAFRGLALSPIKQTVSLGLNTPAASSITTGSTNTVLFQFNVAATEGNSTIKKVIVNQSGTASIGSGNSISNFKLIEDANNDGVAQSGEISAALSTGTVSGSDITFSSITLSSYINEGASKNFIVIGDVSGTGSGTFKPSIVSNKTLNSVNYTTNITNAGGSWLNIGTTAPSGNTLTISGGTTTVNLSISTSTGSEALTTSITLTLVSGAAVSGAQTVDVALSGTGLTNADFTGVNFPAQITIPNGGTSGTLIFTVNDDVISEGTETATFTISNPTSGITLGSTTTQNFSITDNDNPVIATTGTLTSFCTASGTASSTQTFAVSGDYLTGNLTITPPAGFEVSTDGGSTYGTSQSVPVSGGNVTGEPLTVLVRISAATAEGTLTAANIVVSGGGATSQNISASGTVGSAVNLSAGDISILGFNGTDPDRFAFVNWVAIPNLTKINFTDNAWTAASGPLATNENTAVWQNNTGSTIAAGTVIAFENGLGFDLGILLSGSMSGIGNGGENIFAYQGPSCNPSFIYGLIAGATTWVTTGSTTNANSYLPSALSTYNIILGANGNGQYSQSRSNQATIALYKPIVNNISNWTTQSTVLTVSSTDFTTGTNPDVNISVSSNTTTETGAPTITITLTASSSVFGNQSVTLAVTGTNITGTDYSLSTTTLTIPDGTTSVTATFQILDDSNIEGAETAILTISSPTSGIILGTTTVQNIIIADNDGATFYSQASGSLTGNIWDIVPSGTGQAISTFGGFSNLRNIVIQSGHTVTIPSGSSGTDVLNLTVDAGGTLKTGGTSNIYFDVFGNITCNGTMGAGSANDGLSFNIENNTCVLNGTGTIDLARIRKDATTPTNASVTINANVNLRFNGACIYNNANNTNFNVTIGNGYSVNVIGTNGSNGDISIDGTAGTGSAERGGNITVNGNLIVSNKIYALSDNATYPCSITIGNTGSITTYNIDLNINSTGFNAFTINSGGTITVNNNFAVQGGTLTTNNGVIINSGGSLMHGTGTPSGGGSVSGNITIKRQGTSSTTKYNLWSTPVASGSLPGSNGYQYISGNGTHQTSDDNPGPDPGWSSFSGSMTTAKGYASVAGGLAAFYGAPNNGSYTPTVNYYVPIATPTGGSNYNLVGNPYPCALSATAFLAANGSSGTNRIAGNLYFWDDDNSGGTGYAASDYAVRTSAGGTAGGAGNTPNGNIGAGQGFYVEALNTGIITFDNTMRNNNNTQFFKAEEDTFMNRIWLDLFSETVFNEILIVFKQDATEERDLAYDAYKRRGNGQIAFAAKQQGDEFAIVAFPPVTGERIVPLTTFVADAGNYTIKNKYSEYMESIPVYLEDRLLGTYTDISNNGSYTTYMTAENTVDRFFLHFAPMITSVTENNNPSIRTYCNGDNLNILLSNLKDENGTLRIVDMTGKEVYFQQNINLKNNFIQVNTSSFAQGVYAVSLLTNSHTSTTKAFIK